MPGMESYEYLLDFLNFRVVFHFSCITFYINVYYGIFAETIKDIF